MDNFVNSIYELRKERGFTQEEIAKELGVSRQTISNWETGSAQPAIDKVIELSNLYGVSIDEMIKKEVIETKVPSRILQSLINKTGTLYLVPDSDIIIGIISTEIKDCKIIDVSPTSIRIITKDKKDTIEKLIFIKDISGFEVEVD